MSPFFVPMMIPDMASGQVSILTGAKAHNACTVTACASGSHSIGDAFRVIQRGQADVMITGGDRGRRQRSVDGGLLRGPHSVHRAMTSPSGPAAPLTKTATDLSWGKAPASSSWKSWSTPKPGAPDLRRIDRLRLDGRRLPHHRSRARRRRGEPGHAGRLARCQGRASPRWDYINAHGTSTEYNDKFETMAIKGRIRRKAYSIPVSSTKSMTGHLLGAAGGVEAIATARRWPKQVIPADDQLRDARSRVRPGLRAERSPSAAVEVAISNSFGFGGHNAVLVFRRYEE